MRFAKLALILAQQSSARGDRRGALQEGHLHHRLGYFSHCHLTDLKEIEFLSLIWKAYSDSLNQSCFGFFLKYLNGPLIDFHFYPLPLDLSVGSSLHLSSLNMTD